MNENMEYKYQVSDRVGDAILVARADNWKELLETMKEMKLAYLEINKVTEVVVHFDEEGIPEKGICDIHGNAFATKSRYKDGMYCRKCWENYKDKSK